MTSSEFVTTLDTFRPGDFLFLQQTQALVLSIAYCRDTGIADRITLLYRTTDGEVLILERSERFTHLTTLGCLRRKP